MTVSRAFRDDAYVRDDLRKRILALAKTMGYTPDPRISSFMQNFVRRSKSGYHETLAFLQYGYVGPSSPNPTSPFLNLFYEGARQRAESLGYRLSIFRDGLNSSVPTGAHSPASGHQRVDHRTSPNYICIATFGSTGLFTRSLPLAVRCGSPRLNRVQSHHYMDLVQALRNLRRMGRTRVVLVLDFLLHSRNQGAYFASFLANQAAKSRDLNARIYLYRTWEEERPPQGDREDPGRCRSLHEYSRSGPDPTSPTEQRHRPGLSERRASTPQFAGVLQHYEYIGGKARRPHPECSSAQRIRTADSSDVDHD